MHYAPEEPGCPTIEVPVLKVLDGDGFLTRLAHPRLGTSVEVSIRFGFIDAPEMQQPGGREARDFLEAIIGGKVLDLAVLTKMDTGRITDRHNRVVAVPYLRAGAQDRADGALAAVMGFFRQWGCPSHRNIELEMVLNGWAWVLDRYEPDQSYMLALDEARRNRRGIWARDDNLHPWEFKKQRYAARSRPTCVPRQADRRPDDARGQALPCPAPGCQGHLVRKNGRFGTFLGCTHFPVCRQTRNLQSLSGREGG